MRLTNALKKKLFLFLGCIVPSISCAYGDLSNMEAGFSRNDIPQSISSAMWNAAGGPHAAEAIVESEEEGYYYWLFRGVSIGYFDSNQSRNISGWPLLRWSHEYLEQKVEITYEAGNFYRAGDPHTYLADDAKLTHLMGCMQKTPLRYGDFTGDGQAELVVFLSDEVSTDIRVFSPQKQKVIFSSKLNFTDSESRENIPDYYLHDAPFQYLSWRHINSDIAAFPATKAYAKLYVDDFNQNDQQDLLVWRKLYESRGLDDDIEGFQKLEELLLHYALVEGEYQPQETEEDVIQGWLADNELTWQDGYPSKSECEGEEGELIPEMHDPLLNDPDVLK